MAVDDRRRGTAGVLQVSAWRGHEDIAVVTPLAGRPTPGPTRIAEAVESLGSRGVVRVLTGALHPPEVPSFLAAGFTEHERLHLLRHDLLRIPEVPEPVRHRRARRRDRKAVLDLDRRAFDDFWTLDGAGLTDAVRATPTARFRVAADRRGPLLGYAVTGLASDRGYLQRLAVDPDHRRAGIGVSLVADCLTWLRRRGVSTAVVNTQEGNEAALALYLNTGFVREPHGLTVLALDLGGST